ncbi:hypothetical protein HNQ59_001503 [Chitinivorax tropicus]|uniref:Virulence sensor protein BvgS n=1 Tax=Chitinivorax tropicus TaxID=714531 RepID=A0A840MHU2_9PROT|nr:response regulator [Chitinivorax tropicus]MBB5018218.1 hypothetical protein [Chitinivorax tropicus]
MFRSITARMMLLTITAVIGLLAITMVGRYEMEEIYDDANNGNINAIPSLILLADLNQYFLRLEQQTLRRIHASDNQEISQTESKIGEYRQQVQATILKYETDGCLGTDCIADNKDRSYLLQEKDLWVRYTTQLDLLLEELRKRTDSEDKIQSAQAKLNQISSQMLTEVAAHRQYNVEIAASRSGQAVATKNQALYIVLGLCGTLLLIIGSIGFQTARSIIRQLGGEPDTASHITSRLAAGDVSSDIPLRPGDTTSLMARIRFMSNTMARLATRAESIGRGNLTDEVELASDQDRLGKAINEMIRMLRAGKLENDRRNWLKDGYSKISAALTGDLNTEQLADTAISLLSRYLDAGRGVFYIYSGTSGQLELIGSYMHIERAHIGARFALGEGAVGQVGRERKPIILAVGHHNQIDPVITGTTAVPPQFTYTYPLLHEKELIGVIELASVVAFDDLKLEFLSNAASMLASLLYVADQRARVKNLLSASEAAERELRIQSEQLREINAQMETQQQQLQQQAEELQQSNTQMEEQQQQLQQQAEELRQSNAQMEEQRQQLLIQNEQLQDAQQEQEAKAAQLAQANQYKSEFLSNMSHELRTPLNSIILLSKMMCNDGAAKLGNDAFEWAKVIHRSGQELLRLINDVLDLSKVEAGKMDLHLDAIASQTVSIEMQGMFEHLAKDKGLNFSVIDDLRGTFVSDWDKLSQILRNLIANAIKFTRLGGVTLTIGHDPDAELPIYLSVRDTGIGIPEEKRALVFEAFQQADGSTSREFGGTGLGLTISLRFAQMLGGTITLSSEPGKGSEFTLHLPHDIAQHAPTPSTMAAPPPTTEAVCDDRHTLNPDDATILLIDDDVTFGRSLLAMNNRLGYKTLVANTGQEGIDLARKHQPQGILLDLELPDMDGRQVLHELKRDRLLSQIPVHIVSARDRDEALLKQGAIGYLQKPVDDDGLTMAERALLKAIDHESRQCILIIDPDQTHAQSLAQLLGTRHATLAVVPDSDWQALKQQYDSRLAIISLHQDVDQALSIAAKLRVANPSIGLVFFADQPTDDEQTQQLQRYSDCIIVKTDQSEQRLQENVERFLRGVSQERIALQTPSVDVGNEQLLSGCKILLVDDDPRNLFVMTAALERYGAELVTALNGKRALDVLGQQAVDVVLMDIMMPEMDGNEAIRSIRANPALNGLPVIAITAKAAPIDQAEVMQAGADDYMAKPVDYDMLLAKISRWRTGRQG